MSPRPIQKGFTLDVVVAVLADRKGTNPELIKEVQRIAAEYSARDRTFDQHRETKRIEQQRSLFAMLPDTRATDAFRQAMIERAWKLLDIGQAEACDALLEFVPSRDAEQMLDEYFREEETA